MKKLGSEPIYSPLSTMSAADVPSPGSMRAPRARWLPAAAAVLVASGAIADPAPVSTTVLGPLVGVGAPLDPANQAPKPIAFYGTDLGFTYEHAGELKILFGDTSATGSGDPIEASTGQRLDDGFGSIDLARWPDPAKIAAGNLPLVRLGQNPGTTEMSAIDVGHALDLFKTPIGGFSNGAREFGLFYLSKPQVCSNDAACSGLVCDTGLGYVGERPEVQEGLTFGCVDGGPYCAADTMNDAAGKPVAGSGLCVDRTSSMWRDDDLGRIAGVAVTHRIGLRDTVEPKRYRPIRDWPTNKFANLALRTVQDFDPARGAGRAQQDYRAAHPGGCESPCVRLGAARIHRRGGARTHARALFRLRRHAGRHRHAVEAQLLLGRRCKGRGAVLRAGARRGRARPRFSDRRAFSRWRSTTSSTR